MPDASNTPDDAARWAAAHAQGPEPVEAIDVLDEQELAEMFRWRR